MDKARRIAVQALVRQEESGFANLVLNAVLEHQNLNGRDRAFVSALFYGSPSGCSRWTGRWRTA